MAAANTKMVWIRREAERKVANKNMDWINMKLERRTL